MRHWITVLFVTALCTSCKSALALEPGEIAIVVQRDDPAGIRLARYYCDKRDVPRDQIVVVKLSGVEEIPWRTFEQRLATPVRNQTKSALPAWGDSVASQPSSGCLRPRWRCLPDLG